MCLFEGERKVTVPELCYYNSQSDSLVFPTSDDEYERETHPGEYEVEAIVGRELYEGWPYYHVKWKNFGSHQNTWAPWRHMKNSMKLVIAYEEAIKEDVRAGPSWHPEGERCKK